MNLLEPFHDVRTFIFDVDGVMTNSELIVLENGHLLRKMNVRDGYALKLAIKKGYRVAIITGGKSSGVVQRLRGLGIVDIYSGVQDKIEALEEYQYTYDLNLDHILYMGDDLPDYEVMRKVGLPACPYDAAPEILNLARYISPRKGGQGCVRDVIEKTLKIQKQWVAHGIDDLVEEDLRHDNT
ncbi:MAG: HAD-IIIA family hydrolase [Bacteroidota bacterium]